MIDVAGTIIQSMTFGTDNIKGIWFGTDKVWPSGVVTTALTNPSVYYSSGTMINAAGSNYAYIQGTLITYIDGQESSRETVRLTPSIVSGTWLSVEDNDIIGANRGTTTGSTRSGSVRGTINGYTTSDMSVSQTANTMTTMAGAITSFALNGNSGRTQTISYSATTLYVSSLSGYRRAVYSSGAEAQAAAQLALRKNDDNTWATINGTSSISIPENTGASSRSVTITAYDQGYYPTVSSSITITQGVYVNWVLTVPTGVTIEYDETGFTITGITSTVNGNPYVLTASNISFGTNPSNVALGTITHLGQGRHTISFTCSGNTGTTTLWSYIYIQQTGGKSATCRVVQGINNDSISGITINNAYGDWVIGTITAGSGNTQGGGTYYTKACIVAKRTPVTSTATVNVGYFAWQWMPPVTGQTPTSYSESNISFTIDPASTVTLKPLGFDEPHVYFGAYMYSPAAGMTLSPHPNLQVNSVSSFSVSGG